MSPVPSIRPRPRAAILTIGDELLVGDRVDTNASWLARFLSNGGFEVERILSVGDAPSEIRDGLRITLESTGREGVVLVTGGLGPTEDDRTRQAVAEYFEIDLIPDREILETLIERFRARGIDRFPPTNRRIALVPEGAEVLPNDIGSAPALALDRPEGRMVLLPGVPAEMKHLVSRHLDPLFDRWFGSRAARAARSVLHTTGIPESALAELLEETMESGTGVNLAYRPSVRGVELVFSVVGDAAGERLEETLRRVAPELEPYRYSSESGDLAEAVLDALRARGWTVALGESCTGGLVAARLTDWPGSSAVTQGGVVAYSNGAKTSLLSVPASLIRRHGAVSGEVALAMAHGAVTRFEADVGVGITGVAGPGGGSPDKPVGTVWFGFVTPEGENTEKIRFPGDRGEVRIRAVQHALHRVFRAANPPNDRG